MALGTGQGLVLQKSQTSPDYAVTAPRSITHKSSDAQDVRNVTHVACGHNQSDENDYGHRSKEKLQPRQHITSAAADIFL